MSSRSTLALLYNRDAYSFQTKIMGRQSAGIGFVKSLAAQRFESVWCHAVSRDDAVALADDLAAAGSPRTGVAWVPYDRPEGLAAAGLLYRPDPLIGPEAWRRLERAAPRAYSLCGITHTIATHRAMDGIAGLLTAPVEEWDAVICTSRVVRDSVRVLLEAKAAYLRDRLGATRFVLPQMPVIPLGVHCAEFSRAALGHPAAARDVLRIPAGRIVVLFVGRLSFHGKAHPLPMYLGLEQAAQHVPITLVQAGIFPNDAIRDAFAADARALCPTVDVRTVDGHDAGAMRDAWAAADIFTSLSDNVQEAFGLTPLEAMAAGLPVVVSDWDGYRDTVRDGIDGIRVPTLMPGPGHGAGLAMRYDLGMDDYDRYCGHVGQFTAVDVAAAGEAYRTLALDPDLRARMGAAGQARAQADYDWPVIFARYQALWDDLGERRRSAPVTAPPLARRRQPERPDPFTLFASYPTVRLGQTTRFRLRAGTTTAAVAAARGLRTIDFAEPILPAPILVEALLTALGRDDHPAGWRDTADLAIELAGGGPMPPVALHQALAWLAKIGAIEFSEAPPVAGPPRAERD